MLENIDWKKFDLTLKSYDFIKKLFELNNTQFDPENNNMGSYMLLDLKTINLNGYFLRQEEYEFGSYECVFAMHTKDNYGEIKTRYELTIEWNSFIIVNVFLIENEEIIEKWSRP